MSQLTKADVVTKQVDDLTRELLSLYVRYGARVFEDALKELRDGAVTNRIVNISTELSQRARRSSPVKRKGESSSARSKSTPKEIFQRYVAELRKSEDEMDISVANFVTEIASKTILTSPRTLRDYMTMLGINASDLKLDRFVAARRIGVHLLQRPKDDVAEKIKTGREMSSESSTLAGWSKIIVKRQENES